MVRKEWKILFPPVINMEIRKILSPHKESNIRSFVWIKSNFNLANRIGINLKWSALISLKSEPLWTRIWFYFFLVEMNICHTYLIKCPTSNRLLPCKKENLIGTQIWTTTTDMKLDLRKKKAILIVCIYFKGQW